MSANKELFENFTDLNKSLCLANNQTADIKGVGTIKLSASKHNSHDIKLEELVYVDDLRTNLLSVSKITDKGYEVIFNKNSAKVTDINHDVIFTANRIGNLYFLNTNKFSANLIGEREQNDVDRWHQKLGHLNESDLKRLANKKLAYGVINAEQKLSVCKVCISEKQSRKPFHKSTRETSNLLEIIHSDVCGPMSTNSFSGARYFVTFIDDKSKWCAVYFIKQKSEVLNIFKKYKAEVELQTGNKIKMLQSDNGKEYCNNEFDNFLAKCGIKRRLTVPHTPQQNGVAERKNRTLVEMARCLMKQSNAPPSIWAEAINTACYIRNRCPTRSLDSQVPYKLWMGKIPALHHMQIFGTKAFYLDKTKKNKFNSRSIECVFVGYSLESKAFRLWCPKRRSIIVSRDVTFINEFGFNNNKNPTPFLSTMPDTGRNPVDIVYENSNDAETEINNNIDVSPNETEVTSSDTEEGDYESAGLASIDDPVNFVDAMKSNDAKAWIKAVEEEFMAQLRNETWEIVKRPLKRKVIGSRFVFKTKENAIKKAQLVAQGCSQRPGEDFYSTFSPVVRSTSIRILTALAAEMNLDIHQMDVVTAYLNGDLDVPVYMETPEHLVSFLDNFLSKTSILSEKHVQTALKWRKQLEHLKDGVCVLKMALYGLKQSGLRWYQKLSLKLIEAGLFPSRQDPCLFTKRDCTKLILVAIYVDDLLIASNDQTWMNTLKLELAKSFEMKDLGAVNTCLGIQFTKNCDTGTFSMSQQKYIDKLLNRFGMLDCKASRTPIQYNYKLLRPNTVDIDIMNKLPYQRLIGSLMYLAVMTRPDIAYSVNFLSQFNSRYNEEHWKAAKRVLRYLKGTSKYGLVFQKTGVPLYGVVDADWASDCNDRRSFRFWFCFGWCGHKLGDAQATHCVLI